MPKWGMVIDKKKCIGCMACVGACKTENQVPQGYFRNGVTEIAKGNFPEVKLTFLPTLCMHCEDAPCVSNCPTGASYKTEDGIVLTDKEKCVGCPFHQPP